MTTEQLRHRMPPILKALKERSLRGRTPVEGLRRTECAYHGWDTVHADAASWEPFAPGDAFGAVSYTHLTRCGMTASFLLIGPSRISRPERRRNH